MGMTRLIRSFRLNLVTHNIVIMYSHHYHPSGSGVPCTDKGFFAYLSQSQDQFFTLDLSNSTVIEIIDELVKIKSKLSPNYGKGYKCLKNNLRILEKEFNCTLRPYQITDIFWHYFIPFLLNRGLALSSIKTLCAQLRAALEWGARHRAPISPTFDLVKIPAYCRQQIALTPDEVSHIYHFDISTIKRRPQHLRKLEVVRDMFVLSCNLGQRFSDMVRLDKTCFDKNIFTILQQKTGTHARVDIDRMSIDSRTTYKILEKYNYTSPLTTDISCYDKYIKELLQYVGFNELIKRETKVNGHISVTYTPKWKLVGSHTARRTFATINVLRGFRTSEIRRATGHKSESSFEKYICYFDD